ncbi:uncharacterized protein LOC133871673 [Alnus glutinosa]|uniref:uncharacterized protein LOC133871673 n=1 Tax=Alnus glutinosa TaxID=3517 RepID=UPI002D77DB81|nr:uncharacterized protein LOC133871673 [Alnus glutinosa]
MITLSWNCRGLSQPSIIRSLKVLVRKHNPDIVFLSETKAAPFVTAPILHQLRYTLMVHALPSSSQGRLLLAWKPDVNIVTFYVTCNIICVWYYSDAPLVKCLLTFVYGPPYKNLCPTFWKAMSDLGISYNDPWVCIGDFNAINSPDDKFGGRVFDSFSPNLLSHFMDGFGMIDLGFSVHLPAHSFDHCPLLLNTSHLAPSLPRPFRFEEFWTKDPTCGVVIEEAWSPFIVGSPSYCLTKKLKLTKEAIKFWNQHYFGNIKSKLDRNLFLLDEVQQAHPSDANLAKELHLQSLLDDYLLQEESLWKTKSRELWLTATDLNTRCFHTSTIIRRRRNSISLLQTPGGGWISDRTDIGLAFVAHFKKLFTSTNPVFSPDLLDLFNPVISELDNNLLCATPTEAEVFASLLSLGKEKAPGLDGFIALFYVKYWDCIKTTVLLVVGNFFDSNSLLRAQNHTFIALILKRLGASAVNHFRPISLCNIIYKIISKLLANRLKPLLSKIISPFQTAFVPSHHIQDNSILSHEMLHSLKNKRGRGGLMAVNIDMEKAFDKMEWGFLMIIMEKLGFHPIWINWIRICISTSSFSILLNGSPFGHFRPSRGLRQGDPLSPFLFILGTEVISRLLHQSLQGFKISRRCFPLTHLLFADDLMIFTHATSSEAGIIKDCLTKYNLWSDQSVNTDKSNILFSANTSASSRASILDILPYAVTPISAKHLGLPMFFGRSKQSSFLDILQKVKGKIEGWRSKTLSQAGKLVLIKVGFPVNKAHNLSLKSWNSICLPKDQGGLGFRLMKDINVSLIAKLGWKILVNHNALWIPLFKEKYIKYGTLLPCPLSTGSYIWNGITSVVPLLKLGSCYIPHSSSSLDIWLSPWIPTLPNFQPVPRIPRLSFDYPLAISDLIHPQFLTWNLSLLLFLFDQVTFSEILKVSIQDMSDSLIWTASASRVFSTKTAHHLYSSSRSPPISPVAPISWKGLWKLKLNHRLKLFLWKMLHLFFSCPIAKVIWRNSFWPLDITALCISDIFDWLHIILHPELIGIPPVDFHLFQIFAMVACDRIWYSRNKAHHDGWIPNALSISADVNRSSRTHFRAWSNKLSPVPHVWTKLAPLCFKINYDTAIRRNFSAQAAVCRDSTGAIIHVLTRISPPCTPLYGEASVALLAATLCSSLGLSHVTFEGDSLTVNIVINNPTITQDWRISSIVSDFISTISPTTSWSASNINRNANFCAHYVAD